MRLEVETSTNTWSGASTSSMSMLRKGQRVRSTNKYLYLMDHSIENFMTKDASKSSYSILEMLNLTHFPHRGGATRSHPLFVGQ